MRRARRAGVIVTLFVLAASGCEDDELVTPPPLSTPSHTLYPVKDNTAWEDAAGALSNGAGSYLFAGRNSQGNARRSFIAFDVADTIPAGARIDSVFLLLNMNRTSGGPAPVALHRLIDDWGEGTSDAGEGGRGAPATLGDATWLHTFYDTAFWVTAGGDYTPTASAVATVADSALYRWGSTAAMVADVQSWLDAPTTNFGWILIGDEGNVTTTKRFDSREIVGAAAGRPPKLIVYSSGP